MRNEVSEKYMVSPYFVGILLYVSMVGAGILNFQRKVIVNAGYNAWISVIITGISMHIILWMIYKLLSSTSDGQEIVTLNKRLFGNILGNILNIAVVLYFVYGAFVKFKVYLGLIQVNMFPVMNVLPMSIGMALIIYYTLSGGFRSVIGISFWATIISFTSVIPQILLTFRFLHPLNLMPLLNHSPTDILLSSKVMVFEYLGVETLLLFFPFIKTPAKSQKWAHMVMFLITLLYLVILVVAIMFFSEGQLRHSIWPTMDMLSIIELPLLQRLEYFFVSLWFAKMMAGICIFLWVACRGMKTAFRIGQRNSLIVFLVAIVTINYFIKDQRSVEKVADLYSPVGFYFIYAYIPFMFVCMLIRKRLTRSAEERNPA